MNWEVSLGRVWLAARVWSEQRRVSVLQRRTRPVPWQRTALTVAGVQWDLRPVATAQEWVARLALQCDEAMKAGAALIVFPEDIGLSLLGLLTEHRPRSRTQAPELSPAQVAALLRAWGPLVLPLYRTVFARLARAYGMTVVAGSTLAESGGSLYNLAHVYGPEGELLAVQPKLHLMPMEQQWGLTPGDALAPLPPGLPVQPLVCHDASFFESYRMAAAQGAELMAVPIADPDPDYGTPKSRRGAWARTQETGLVSVVGAGTGELYGIVFTGKAAVYAPLAETPAGDGVLAESAHPDAEGVVFAEVNLEQLAEHRTRVPTPRDDLVAAWLAPRYQALSRPEPAQRVTN